MCSHSIGATLKPSDELSEALTAWPSACYFGHGGAGPHLRVSNLRNNFISSSLYGLMELLRSAPGPLAARALAVARGDFTKLQEHNSRPYRVEYTGSLLTSEVKRRKARLVLGWGTAREDLRVLPAFGC